MAAMAGGARGSLTERGLHYMPATSHTSAPLHVQTRAPTRPGWRPLLETKPDFVRIMDITTMRASDDPRTMIPAPHPRAWKVPQIADIRESAWDVYHGKFPQAASRRFRRTSSAPSQDAAKSGETSSLMSWGSSDLFVARDIGLLEEESNDAHTAARRRWRPASVRPASARTTYSHTSSSILSAAPTPRPPSGPSSQSSRANAVSSHLRPKSARLAHEEQGSGLASNRSLHGGAIRPPSAPARSHTNQNHRPMSARARLLHGDNAEARKRGGATSPLSSCGRSSNGSPVKSVVSATGKSARRERSYNSISARQDVQQETQGAISVGSLLPQAWTPPGTPRGRQGELDIETFKRAEAETNVRLPRKRIPQYQRKVVQQESSQGDGPSRTKSDGGEDKAGSPTKKGAKYGSQRKSLFDKDEKLVGMHVKKSDLNKEKTQVVYSQLYLAAKELDPEDVESKGTGTVIGWDPDGLMTDVRWEDGETEYCCTGFNRLYHLALKLVVDEDGEKTAQGWEDPGKKLMSKMASYPNWNVEAEDRILEGVSRMPICGQFRVYKDIWDELHHQRELRQLIKNAEKEGRNTTTYQKSMEVSRKTMANLELDQALMSEWIVSKINNVEIRIPPSELAPPGPGLVTCKSHKRPSLREEVIKQVNRDTEKARRQAKMEEQAEKERIRLEQKAIRLAKRDPNSSKAKELRELAAKCRKKQARLHMEPLEAVLSANAQELDELLADTFTLFDADSSNSLDLVEFEQAINAMGIKGQSDNLQALVKAMDSDGNGTLDLSEFKVLTKQLIEIAQDVKTDVDKKKKLQMLNRRRKAAGQPPLARLPGEKAQPVAAAAAPGQGDSGQKEQGQVGAQGVNPGEEEASAWDIMRNLVKDKYKSNTDQTKQAQAQADSKKQKTISFQYDEDSDYESVLRLGRRGAGLTSTSVE